MTKSVEEIISLFHARKTALAPVHSRMAVIRDQYQNETRVPLPELDKNEPAVVANLVAQGVDQMAMRIASTVPSVTCPPLRPGIERSETLAHTRRLAIYGWWEANRFDRKQRKRSKWLVAYAAAPALIRPDFKRGIPLWQLPEPLSTFPGPTADPDDICPPDGILAYRRTLTWLKSRYPQAAASLELGKDPSPDTLLDVLEYMDDTEHVLIAVGNTPDPAPPTGYLGPRPRTPGLPYLELERFANRIGRCPLVYPTRPSLECPISQFDGMPAVYRMQARAMALWMISTERSIFPDTWFISRPNEQVDIIAEPDGRAGIPGQVRGGDLKEVNTAPNPQTGQIIELLDRNMSRSASLPAAYGGEEPSQVRTGRAGEQLLSATVDYWVQEAQETLALAYTEENKLAVAVAKTFFGDTPKSFYINWKGSRGPVDYIPNVAFETDHNIVNYPQAGSDINQLVVGLGQRLGLDEISVQTAQELDPYIDDPEEEQRRLFAQTVRKSFMASVDQAVAAGQVGPTELSRLVELVETGRMDPYKAWQQIHQETQQAQAQVPGQPGAPEPGSPETMPGLSAPGVQAAQGLPGPGPAAGVSQPQPGVQHLQQLLGALHGGK